MNKLKTYSGWIVMALGVLACFLFFQLYYPHHLLHREQVSLFLYSEEYILDRLMQPGGVSILGGEFLIQFFYFIGGGATVVSLLLLLLGFVSYQGLRRWMGHWMALLLTVAVCLWEGGRLCLINYPLASTLSLIAVFTVLRLISWKGPKRFWKNAVALTCIILFIPFQPLRGVKAWGKPNFYLEHLLAIDINASYGKWEKVSQLTQKDLRTDYGTYYFNLSNALKGQLPEKLMSYYQPFSKGLFLPVDPSGNYLTFIAANELWFMLGDMTMAEHSAILGMISTTDHHSSRILKRMAEINLINGDDEAALKYLRMLQKTWKYRDWANQRIPGKQTPAVQKWLEHKRQFIPQTDTLRASADARLSLRHLLKSNPDNLLAYHYLLCYELLNKDIASFAKDYIPGKGLPCRLYHEAILIHLIRQNGNLTEDDFKTYQFTPEVLQDFQEYTRIYEQNHGNGSALQAQYGKTYWFYYHFTTMKK